MPTSAAYDAFAQFLQRADSDEGLSLEDYCAERPEVAEELRRLHALLRRTLVPGDGHGDSVFAQLGRKLGSDVDPGIVLDKASAAEGSGRSGLPHTRPAGARYAVRGEVARGGMGLIYKVWDENLRRTLAMKVVLGTDASPGRAGTTHPDRNRLNRFLEEAQITGQLDHPGIVPVHELGLDDAGRVYFTMRLVKGRDLKEVFGLLHRGEGDWTQTRVLHVMLRVCEAVAFAHEKGVVHRDLKPANVMVGRFGEVYVMDWGLAKIVGREDQRDPSPRADPQASLSEVRTDRRDQAGIEPDAQLYTMDGDVLGTPCYMSPEQARGETDRVGPRSDVYSGGSMLYHLLAGRTPYVPPEGGISPQAVLAFLIHGPPQPLTEIAPGLPPELVAICNKAMAREPEERYETMLAMAEDLRAFLEGRVVRAYETGAVAEFRKWVRRNRAVAASLAALLAVVVGGSVGFAWQQGRLALRIENQRVEAALARDAAVESEREALRKSYLANLVAADVYLKANEVPEALRLLAACDEDLRGWEWRHLALKADGSLAVLPHPGEVGCVAFAPDGELVATGCADGVVRIWRAPEGEAIAALAGHADEVLALDFAPDGARLASASRDGTLRIWDLASGRARLVLSDHEAPVTAVVFSAGGEHLASGAMDGGVRLWDPSSGNPLATIDTGGRTVAALAFSEDGGRLWVLCSDGGSAAWDTASGEQLHELVGGEGRVECAAFAAGGERLAIGSIDGSVLVREGRGGRELARLHPHADPIFCMAFSPAGGRLVTGSLDKTLRLHEAGGQQTLSVLYGHEQPVRAVAFSADGERLASGSSDETARLWGARVGGATLVLELDGEPVSAVAMALDGRRVAAASSFGGRIRVWDALSGAALASIETGDDPLRGLVFSPDGEWLVAGEELSAALRRFDARTGQPVGEPWVGHDASITALAITDDGRRLASASTDQTVRVWDAASGRGEVVMREHEAATTSVAFTLDGSRVVSGSMDGALFVWESGSGRVLASPQGHEESVLAVAFSPDGERIASGSLDRAVRIWNSRTGELERTLTGHAGAVYAVAFDPSGSRLVSGSFDKTLHLWDSLTGERLFALRGHERPVTSLAFSSDGSRIVSGAFDGTVRVWETAAPLQRFLARQAASMVDGRIAAEGSVAAAERAIEADRTLDDELRSEALRIAGWR